MLTIDPFQQNVLVLIIYAYKSKSSYWTVGEHFDTILAIFFLGYLIKPAYNWLVLFGKFVGIEDSFLCLQLTAYKVTKYPTLKHKHGGEQPGNQRKTIK